jgi:hypothetical protein
MSLWELVRAIGVDVVVPLVGIKIFLSVRERMLDEQIERPPVIPLLIVFATYGTLLILILTVLLWRWSGLASLGFFYVVLLAPVAMAVLAVILYRQRRLSRYHFGSFVASAVYPFVMVPTVLLYGALHH